MDQPVRGGGARYTGRTAVVTGAASGIGAATAARLAQEGAAVVLADIDEERGRAEAERITREGGRARFVRTDVADEGDWRRVVDAAHSFGPVDLLVSNAYTVDVRPAHELSLDSWRRQLDVNLTGASSGSGPSCPTCGPGAVRSSSPRPSTPTRASPDTPPTPRPRALCSPCAASSPSSTGPRSASTPSCPARSSPRPGTGCRPRTVRAASPRPRPAASAPPRRWPRPSPSSAPTTPPTSPGPTSSSTAAGAS